MRDDLTARVDDGGDLPVVVLGGGLTRRSAPDLHHLLRKVLLDRGRVIVEVGGLQIASTSALAVFPTVLAAVGGWPDARMVLCAAGGPVVEGMRRSGRTSEVAVAADRPAAQAQLLLRPPRVRRTTGLPSGVAAARYARALAQAAAAEWAVREETAEGVVTVANELATNAVLHAGGESELILILDRSGVRVGVRDGSDRSPPRALGPDHLGLRTVAGLSAAWGVARHRHGKTVWALLRPEPCEA